MCWRTFKEPIKQVAEEDIYVFKLVTDSVTGKLRSFYYYFIYDIGKEYSVIMDRPKEDNFIDSTIYSIHQGFHSYSCAKYYRIINNERIIRRLKIFEHKKIYKAKCIIPKGSEYYVNEYGEYVSNRIKIISYKNILNEYVSNRIKVISY